MQIVDLLKDLLGEFLKAVPNFVGAILIFIVGWIVAKAVSKIVLRFLKTIKIDRFAEKLNQIDMVSKSNFNIVPSILLSKFLYYILLIIFAIAATDVLGMPAVSQLMTDIINYVPNLITAFIVLAVGLFVADFIKNIVLTTCKSLGIPSAKIISSVVFYFLFLVILMSALSQAKINTEFITSSFTVIIGGIVLAFAIGYGLASKDVMANYLASFTTKKKFKVGDRIKIGDVEGEIIEMDNTTMVIRSDAGKVHVPLSKMNSENIAHLN